MGGALQSEFGRQALVVRVGSKNLEERWDGEGGQIDRNSVVICTELGLIDSLL
jgi:hypothetical protein